MTVQSHIRRGYFDGHTGQVHYRLIGARGDRPLLLLHQSPLSGTQFDAAMPLLASLGYCVIAPDMPGFGMSDVPLEGSTLEDFASIVDAVREGMQWSRVSIVGHHTGAVLGAVYARRHPEIVEKLVLNGFPLLSEAERKHFASFYFGPKEPQLDGSHLLKAWETRLRATPGWTDIHLMHRYTVEALHRGATNWKAFPLVISADLESVLLDIK
ncbi:MAG: alpha/beta fold hydrolase, partial [Steroidobacteraceae bacterium]